MRIVIKFRMIDSGRLLAEAGAAAYVFCAESRRQTVTHRPTSRS